MKDLLAHYPVIVQVPVAWGDMDAMSHVNNTVYFRYFETARIAYFEKMGLMAYMQQTGVGPILASAQCTFKLPLTYPDSVSIGARITKMQDDRFTTEYRVVSHRHNKIAAEGEGLIVCFDYRQNRKTLLPDELRQRIEALEATAR